MTEEREGKEILGGGCIRREVWRHVRLSITYLTRGLEGIAAETETDDELRGDGCDDELAFDFYFGCGFFLGSASALEVIGKLKAEISGVRGVGHSDFKFHHVVADQFFDFTVEVLHALGIAITHGIEQGFAFTLAFFHVIASAHGGLKNLDCGDAAFAVFLRKQALRNDKAKGLAEPSANSLLIGKRKNADNA